MKIKKAAFVIFVSLITILLCEIAIRVVGYRPGVFRKMAGFEVVGSLISYKNFDTDEAGIYKFSPWVTDSLRLYINPSTGSIENNRTKNSLYHSDHIEDIYLQFMHLDSESSRCGLRWRVQKWLEKEDWNTEFVRTVSIVKRKSETNEWESAILNYLKHPFNAEGFRSIEYKYSTTLRPKILIIGDSFVYGMSSNPFFNSFSDILLAREYMVYAAGIPGTDPAQYAAIAQKYIPILKPDIVIVCFYEGNDFMRFPREPNKDHPHEHMTNAGFFSSNPLGSYLDSKQAYNYYLSLVSIPEIKKNSFNQFCSKSALGGLLWNAAYKFKKVSHSKIALYDSVLSSPYNYSFTSSRLALIDSIGQQNQAAILPVVIPDIFAIHNKDKKNLTIDSLSLHKIFSNKTYYSPINLISTEDFPKGDYHFNNKGSLKFANFLDTLIKQHIILE